MAIIPVIIIYAYLFFTHIVRYFIIEGRFLLKLTYFLAAIPVGLLLSLLGTCGSILIFADKSINAYGLFFFALLGPFPIFFLCCSEFFEFLARNSKSTLKAAIGLAFCFAVIFSLFPWFGISSDLIDRYSVNITY